MGVLFVSHSFLSSSFKNFTPHRKTLCIDALACHKPNYQEIRGSSLLFVSAFVCFRAYKTASTKSAYSANTADAFLHDFLGQYV
jgi:hypothetical protein